MLYTASRLKEQYGASSFPDVAELPARIVDVIDLFSIEDLRVQRAAEES